MPENNITNFLQVSKMEEILYDLSQDIVNVKHKKLSEQEIKKVCDHGYAFKLGDDTLIGKSYLKSYILQELKRTEQLDPYLKIAGYTISPLLVSQILEDLVSQKLALKEGSIFKRNLELMISEETITALCQYRIDKLNASPLTKKLGFSVQIERKFDIFCPTEAFTRCKEIINTLIEKIFLLKTVVHLMLSIGITTQTKGGI